MNQIKNSLFFFLIILVLTGCSDKKTPKNINSLENNEKGPGNTEITPENYNGPDIYIDGLKYKFGKVMEGRDVVFTFYYKNTGAQDLIIEELDVSCFCVIIRQYDKIVKPGEKGKIYGVIETKGFLGEIQKFIKIKTNIQGKEPDILTLEGEILTISQWLDYKKKQL